MDSIKLTGKTVIVTGANTGIGKETAVQLAKRGARVILACRDRSKSESARLEIISETANDNVVVKLIDLASLKSIKSFADDFNQNEARLDILVNNAGVYPSTRQETQDRFELDFGTMHLGHFYLTNLLLDKLKQSAPSRIVVVSSYVHNISSKAKIDFNDLQLTRGWTPMKAYGRSKTANILFATHLAKLLEGTGVTTYSLHPGLISTELQRDSSDSCGVWLLRHCCCCFYSSIEDGAKTTLYCCLEPTIVNHSGRYYSNCKEDRAKSYATDPVLAEKLWRVSEELCQLTD